MRRFVAFAFDRPQWVVSAFALLALAGMALASVRLRSDNTIRTWLPRGEEVRERYEEFRRLFGDAGFLVAAAERDAGDDRVAARLREALVGAARGGPVRIQGPLEGDRDTAFVVFFDGDPGAAGTFVDDVRARIGGATWPGAVHVAGPLVLNHDLDRGVQRSFTRLLPLVLALIFVVLAVALRSPVAAAAKLVVAGVPIAVTLGAMAWLDRPLNLLTSTIPALLVVLATAAGLHVTLARTSAGERSSRPWRRAALDKAWPCTLAALTTAAGFLALAGSDLVPIRDFGIFGAAGILVSLPVQLGVLPVVFDRIERRGWPGLPARPPMAPPSLLRHRRIVIASFAALAAVMLLGLPRLRLESHILSFLPEGHPVATSTRAIEERVMGLTPIELWVRGDDGGAAMPAVMERLGALARRVSRREDVTHVVLPDPGDAGGERVRTDGASVDLRVTILGRTTTIEESDAAMHSIERAAEEALRPLGYRAEVTGSVPLLVRMQRELPRAQARSLILSIALVTLIVAFALGSLRLSAVGLIANVLPVGAMLGAMGHLGIRLDVATVTVSGIAFALVVDDTIHILCAFRRARSTRPEVRLRAVFAGVGRPVLVTSLATAAGFSAFAASPFPPTARFGLLVAACAAVAVLADLLLLPALLGGGS